MIYTYNILTILSRVNSFLSFLQNVDTPTHCLSHWLVTVLCKVCPICIFTSTIIAVYRFEVINIGELFSLFLYYVICTFSSGGIFLWSAISWVWPIKMDMNSTITSLSMHAKINLSTCFLEMTDTYAQMTKNQLYWKKNLKRSVPNSTDTTRPN